MKIFEEHPIVPVVVLDDESRAADLGRALVGGGLPIAEVTLRTPGALAAIATMARNKDLLVGAGTVLTPEQATAAAEAGARFAVCPGLSRAVVERCGALGLPVLPGVATATEVLAAREIGLEAVKFFPAETSGGAPAVAALAAVFGDMRFVPTGGITAANAGDYLALPSVLAVGGSWMVPRSADLDQIHELIGGVRDVIAAAGR
ncbi:bifunctional 4-hydroxy-2-oxoglutarate aldolase/2-dehydro-3-deoxy-phosphogluconate aldolase [Actinoplanes sp. NPDC023936]|uniref:bifunctional 4-hydroxy-2-oxoglutarate aldolase/2-dehydro-3-deoxy-phosphogluconate aldolase n=1 Tax=unclassified Actinoplanes TaxID=2626549 RepID=UPI001E5AFE76|nr:bifunctional 4-hydroxy-2-oxoglutarate aldolase/2-dehydro-3-deoxy-phosphogluconate aldolase [Actinoplanes sp. DH11]